MDVLADALPILEDALAKKRILVTIQCNVHHYEERTDRALRQLEALQKRFPGAVHLVTSSLSSEEYYRMLAEADVILLPYRRGDYAARTSGIFAEALAAGKPVIVTTGTWMSAQLDHHGAGIGISDGAPQELAAAILRMEREHPAFASKALAGVSSWIAVHNDEQLLRSLLSYFGADA
jgi:glycosyltransferase involved in cell wall biosynthesis